MEHVRHIFVARGMGGAEFWEQLHPEVQSTSQMKELESDPEKFELVCFTGGADISPELYGHPNLASSVYLERDAYEMHVLGIAREYNIPVTGICRGAQLFTAVFGGTLVQHLGKHGGGRHWCDTSEGENFVVNSLHHQMMVPSPEAQIVAWARERVRVEDCVYHPSEWDLPAEARDPENPNLVRVPEAVAWPEHRAFGVQFHPEMMNPREPAAQWTLQKIREFCWGELAIQHQQTRYA